MTARRCWSNASAVSTLKSLNQRPGPSCKLGVTEESPKATRESCIGLLTMTSVCWQHHIDLSPTSYIVCVCCGSSDFEGSRLVCLDCVDPTTTLFSQIPNFCSRECFNTTLERPGTETHYAATHDAWHDVLKLRAEVSWLELPEIYKAAIRTLQRARTQTRFTHTQAHVCSVCGADPRRQAYWCCVACEGKRHCIERR